MPRLRAAHHRCSSISPAPGQATVVRRGRRNTATTAALVLSLALSALALIQAGPAPRGVQAAATSSWVATGSLDQCQVPSPLCRGRSEHTATLLDGSACRVASPPDYCGEVLISGGCDAPFPTDPPPPSGLENNCVNLNSAELYDPATGRWSLTGPMAVPRSGHVAAPLPDGRVLVLDGALSTCASMGAGSPCPDAEIYDPAAATWSAAPPQPVGVPQTYRPVTAQLPDGRLVVISASSYDHRVEIFNPATMSWSVAPGPPTPTYQGQVASPLPSGRVLVAGGTFSSGTTSQETTEAAIFDPATGTWTKTGSLKGTFANYGVTAVLLPTGPASACGAGCGRVLLTGTDGPQSFSPELFDPNAVDPATGRLGSWSYASLVEPDRVLHTATLLPSGKVLIAGGDDTVVGTRVLSEAELYDPAMGQPTRIDLPGPRFRHSATVIPTGCGARQVGEVLVAGGYDHRVAGPEEHALASALLYPLPPAPKVTGLSVRSGPSTGGTRVAISGTDLGNASQVSFDGTAAAFTQVSTERIDAVSPPHRAEAVHVMVTTPDGTSPACTADLFTFVDPGHGLPPAPPTVTGVTPDRGPTAGRTRVTIAGTGFREAGPVLAVTFGRSAALGFSVVSDTQITAYTPPHGAGTVDVSVTTPAGTSAASAADQYTYEAPQAKVATVVAQRKSAADTALRGTVQALSGKSTLAAPPGGTGGAAPGPAYVPVQALSPNLQPGGAPGSTLQVEPNPIAGPASLPDEETEAAAEHAHSMVARDRGDVTLSLAPMAAALLAGCWIANRRNRPVRACPSPGHGAGWRIRV